MSAVLDAEGAPPADARSRLLELIARGCTEATRRHARAGVLLLALDDLQPSLTAEVIALLNHWQRCCRGRMHWADLGEGRVAAVIAPIGFGSHADEIGELLVRAIAPQPVRPALQPAPVVSFGRSLFPDHGTDPEELLRRAERSLAHRRAATIRGEAGLRSSAAPPVPVAADAARVRVPRLGIDRGMGSGGSEGAAL